MVRHDLPAAARYSTDSVSDLRDDLTTLEEAHVSEIVGPSILRRCGAAHPSPGTTSSTEALTNDCIIYRLRSVTAGNGPPCKHFVTRSTARLFMVRQHGDWLADGFNVSVGFREHCARQ
jgi:hypothetical protein